MHISERSRTVAWDDPRPGARAARTMSGLAYLQAMQRGDLRPTDHALAGDRVCRS